MSSFSLGVCLLNMFMKRRIGMVIDLAVEKLRHAKGGIAFKPSGHESMCDRCQPQIDHLKA